MFRQNGRLARQGGLSLRLTSSIYSTLYKCTSVLSLFLVDGKIQVIGETKMTENNNDRYQQIYQEALKACPQDKKSTVQRKACNLEECQREGEEG